MTVMAGIEETLDEELLELRRVIVDAQYELVQRIAAYCPGFHWMEYHKDGKAKWCKACRRYEDGRKVE